MPYKISRRTFLRNATVESGVTILTGGIFKAGAYAANEKLNTGLIDRKGIGHPLNSG